MTEQYTHTEQNYIKIIYHLTQADDGTAYTQKVADAMSTSPASATDMIKKLSDKGLVAYVPYRGAKLNKKGERTALHIIRRHRLWELFLTEVLKFKWDEVHPMAEELEHVSSDLLLSRIDKFLNYPKFDPHGDPIPDAEGRIAQTNYIRLAELIKNQSGTIAGVEEHSPEFLKYLEETGLTLSSTIKVINKHSFDGSIDIIINNKKQVHVSSVVTNNLLIDINTKNRT
jgi:DtxR family transcriptional regulator, Mn-dependent transcriptional regulator